MKIKPLELRLPEDLAPFVGPQPWLKVSPSEKPAVRGPDGSWIALKPTRLPRGLPLAELRDVVVALVQGSPAGSMPLIVSAYLRSDLRALLEQTNAAYLDARGYLHLRTPHALVHVDAPPPREKAPPSGLGVGGVKAIQAVFGEEGPISVSSLAARAEISVGQAHKILMKLEQRGLLRATGRGPRLRRELLDRTKLLDWLQLQPAATRRERRLEVSLYARTFKELAQRVHDRLESAAIAHAVTGPAAASLFGAGPTHVPVVSVRIDPQVPLNRAAQALNSEVATRGANVVLLRDTAKVGTTGTVLKDRIRVAPEVRIYLDTLGEKRGEDIAQHFREAVLGY